MLRHANTPLLVSNIAFGMYGTHDCVVCVHCQMFSKLLFSWLLPNYVHSFILEYWTSCRRILKKDCCELSVHDFR